MMDRDLRILEAGLPLLKSCMDLTTTEIKDVGAFQEAIVKLVEEIRGLAVGRLMLVPGGWDGTAGASCVVHLIERTSQDAYALVTCNSGAGLGYHPCCPAEPPKIKYRTCIRQENIPAARMTSLTFWATLCSQWMKVMMMMIRRGLVRPGLTLTFLVLALLHRRSRSSTAWRWCTTCCCRGWGTRSCPSLWLRRRGESG
jgi:hypothetical protein